MTTCDILIHQAGLSLLLPGATTPQAVCATADEMAAHLAQLCAARRSPHLELTLYAAEELLFCTRFTLPAKTPRLAEAIRYQLGMLVPFPEETFRFRFTATREGDAQQIILYALRDEGLLPLLQTLTAGGHTLTGLFPEHQRYVSRAAPKEAWALLLEGRATYLLLFRKTRLLDRVLCRQRPTSEELATLAGSETSYHAVEPPAPGLLSPVPLLAARPLHKTFDLLPEDFRRPDYFKTVLAGLLVANLALLVLLGGLNLFETIRFSHTVNREISAIMPQVKVVNALLSRQEKLEQQLAAFREIGGNPDIVGFLAKLSTQLPPGAYLDQLRVEKRQGSYLIEGYAGDIASLTAALQGLGEVKLKSTSRRQDQNYFLIEITPR